MDIFLTIDDAPSLFTQKKIDRLLKHSIPAVFYVRGEFIQDHFASLVSAVNNNFLLGNHSYSHPYFSQIPLERCFDEILKTDSLIEEVYRAAQVSRPIKCIRLPFADRGAGPQAALPNSPESVEKVERIQNFLLNHSFEKLPFHSQEAFVDSFWTWDCMDYKSKFINDPDLFLSNLKDFFKNTKNNSHVFLAHDFDHNHQLFEISIDFLIAQNVHFKSFLSL